MGFIGMVEVNIITLYSFVFGYAQSRKCDLLLEVNCNYETGISLLFLQLNVMICYKSLTDVLQRVQTNVLRLKV